MKVQGNNWTKTSISQTALIVVSHLTEMWNDHVWALIQVQHSPLGGSSEKKRQILTTKKSNCRPLQFYMSFIKIFEKLLMTLRCETHLVSVIIMNSSEKWHFCLTKKSLQMNWHNILYKYNVQTKLN